MAKSKLIQAAAITFAVFLAGCATTEDTGSSGEATSTTGTGTTDEELTLDTDTTEGEQSVTSEFQALLDQTIVYFDFDKSEIRTEFRTVLNAHAMNLVANPNMSIVLEGHADERGTREYNLALGERRAQAVADYLMLKGAAASQIDTVSYGEERPVALGSTEADYAENRRVEIVY
ncbi:peptidoglycan-associated lipoprotein [Saccharospirillum sp. MSK14-1]|uniref:peptidoglycan-associated lipoprotein Pal n=1 Tax=Saccharospirillum sp. MSK14-1 TaxID=1897632 RepID=UPI000D334D85|nr:peptidoglycan-associated lipoprotein Pal [Saccharospirillum sp. MSK14-1]PTY37116.1 peptidoglycan-associated lipoprotein [Saccharospirillum sp. MSK14-1]